MPIKKETQSALASLEMKNAGAKGWIMPAQATPQQQHAASLIQAWVRGWLARKHRKHGIAGRLEGMIETAEMQMIKHERIACLCNLTTRWGCHWSSDHRKPLLIGCAILIVTAFIIQKFAFLGLFLSVDIMALSPWAHYDLAPNVLLSILFNENSSEVNSEWLSAVRRTFENGESVETRANIWGQCAWIPVNSTGSWGDGGLSTCLSWSNLQSLTTPSEEAAAYANSTASELAAVNHAFGECDYAGDQCIPAVCVGLVFSIFPIADSFSRWTLEKDSGHAKCIGMLISTIVMIVDAFNFFRYHQSCIIRLEEASALVFNARHGLGFVCIYLAWLLTAIAFSVKAFIPAMDLRDTVKAEYYKAEMHRAFQERNPFRSAIQRHKCNSGESFESAGQHSIGIRPQEGQNRAIQQEI